jgi:hypothetical protein
MAGAVQALIMRHSADASLTIEAVLSEPISISEVGTPQVESHVHLW